MSRNLMLIAAIGLLAAGLFVAGCGTKPAKAPASNAGESHDAVGHGHATGIEALGDYHARIAVEEGGVLKLFILGKDESKVARIDSQEIKGRLLSEGQTEGVPVTLKPNPQPGDPAGQTSEFVGAVPEGLRGKALIADLRIMISGEAYRREFKSIPGSAQANGHGVRVAISGDAEKELFLTPGGLYTAEDIKANGGIVPSQKFKGLQFHAFDENEPELKPGDKICPVTNNRSNAKCTWIVNGKQYEFCCPPCLNKFVAWAKKQPEKIKDPSTYVYKE